MPKDVFIRGYLAKVLHNGQKVYAVVKEVKDDAVTMAYVYPSPEGLLTVVTVDMKPSQVRTTFWDQRGEMAVFVRQMTGVQLEEPKPVAAVQKAAKIEVTPEMIDNFKVQGTAIKDMPDGVQKELAKATAKILLETGGGNSIDFK